MIDLPTLVKHLGEAGLDATPASTDAAAWDRTWSQLPYQPVACQRAMLDYQHAYFRGAGWIVHDISLVLLHDGRPCALWPLTLGGPPGSPQLTSAGAPVQAPLFVAGLSPRTVKKLCIRALGFMRAVGSAHGSAELTAEQAAEPQAAGQGASEWHQQLMAAGARPTLRHDLFADLQPGLADIRASFRKSFRPLINVGLRNWRVAVLLPGQADAGLWHEFKQLHRDVAGRTTRSDETWSLQYAMVEAGTAFLVALRDPADGRLVGAGFFTTTRDEGAYSVAAYDRSLFDKPLGHVVQQLAIETMKAQGIRWYRIGERQFHQDEPAPSDKQVAISSFKHGFASHLFCRTRFDWATAAAAAVEPA